MSGVQVATAQETSSEDEEFVHYSIGFNRCLLQRIERERQKRVTAERERDEAIRQRDELGEENQQLQEQITRLEYRNDERGLPRVCRRCRSNTVIVTCLCGEILLEDKPYHN